MNDLWFFVPNIFIAFYCGVILREIIDSGKRKE